MILPVTLSSAERSFSKLKLIKNYLRSTMLQERLTGISILRIENKIAIKLNLEEVISNFVEMKTRKVDFK